MSSVQPTPLRQYGFWRLVLDEAQVVANSASKGARTVANIVRRHAWVVTGDVTVHF
jgi:E3 ubiquitin-protein ligase SHPRH